MQNLTQPQFEKYLDGLSDSYFNGSLGAVPVSDSTFDELKELYQVKFGVAYNKVGHPPVITTSSLLREVKLPFYISSLNKIKTERELKLWLSKYPHNSKLITDKLDGLSGIATVSRDSVQLFKRGDRLIGTDITHIVPHIHGYSVFRSVGSKLQPNEKLYVRGELIMSRTAFERYSSRLVDGRSAVSGLTNTKEVKPDELRDIRFVVYQLLSDNVTLTSHEQLLALKEYGFEVPWFHLTPTPTTGGSGELSIQYLSSLLTERKGKGDYTIDGLVVSDSSSPHQLPEDENPKYAIAYKGKQEEATTTVTEVKWNVSKHGYLKPTIKFETVTLSNIQLRKATGFNAKFVLDNGIGPGAEIIITRNIVPHVTEVTKRTEPSMPPGYLEGRIGWTDNKVDLLVATGTGSGGNEEEMKIQQLIEFFKQLGCKYLGEATIKNLYNHGFNTVSKILLASEGDLIQLERIKKASASRVVNEISQSIEKVTLPQLMSASSVFGAGFGIKKIGVILGAIPDILTLSIEDPVVSSGLIKRVSGIPTIKEKTAIKFVRNLSRFREFLEETPILKLKYDSGSLTNGDQLPESNSTELSGECYVFSGFRDGALENEIKRRGGKMVSGVTKKATGLVVKDDRRTGKRVKAEEYGLRILKADEFKRVMVKK